jgi:hypothetical protein
VEAALRLWGLRGRLDQKFSCVLPGHGPDRHPSASLVRGGDGVWRYFDWHHKLSDPVLTLAEVHCAVVSRAVRRLPAPSQAQWYRRLFYDAGMLAVSIEPPSLRGDSAEAHGVAKGFALLLALRDLRDGGPAPFTWDFAAAWCGMGRRQAGDGIRQLVRGGVLVEAGYHRGAKLYELGSQATTQRKVA